MSATHSAFTRYIDTARQGRNAVWRLCAGIVLIALFYLLTMGVLVLAGFFASRGWTLKGTREEYAAESALLIDSPLGVALYLATALGLIAGAWLAIRYLHRRPFSTLLGATGQLSWPNLARAFAATLIVIALFEAIFSAIDPSLSRGPLALQTWLVRLVAFAALIFLQVSAEEIVFRGYLLQSLAARFRSPVIWAGLPAIVFAVLHLSSEASFWDNFSYFVVIIIFAAATTMLLCRTGDLGAAIGLHFGFNIFAMLVASDGDQFDTVALLVRPPDNGMAWTPSDALWAIAIDLARMALCLVLLLHPRSPLRVRPLTMPPPDPVLAPTAAQ